MKRVSTKIGDIFEVPLGGNKKKYFQFVALDLSQLNSDVIRAFKQSYELHNKPSLIEILDGEVDFHAHCVVKLGVKLALWEKIGRADVRPLDFLFRGSSDSGCKPGEQVYISEKWYVWRINEDFRRVGKLTGENRKAEIGVVVNPYDILDRMKTGKYDFFYPGFE